MRQSPPEVSPPIEPTVEDTIIHHLRYSLGLKLEQSSKREICLAISLAVRNILIERMFEAEEQYRKAEAKRLYYLSMEFLIGRSLANNLSNLGLTERCRESLKYLGVELDEIFDEEEDAALGNGGLGRLAACFLDSLATLHMPGYGCGINYEYGLFKQVIDQGQQKEQPDHWIEYGSPWVLKRPEDVCTIPLSGHLESSRGPYGRQPPKWIGWQEIIGLPHNLPIVGYGGETVNRLRLYSARSSHEFDMEVFSKGDYLQAVEQKVASEMVSKVLYPSDSVERGRELRLIQEYFLVACALEDIFKMYLASHDNFDAFPSKVAIQLNDTHPALAVAELMRRLIDDHHLDWAKAWDITQATLAYTNHTLLPEALEKWSLPLFEHVLL